MQHLESMNKKSYNTKNIKVVLFDMDATLLDSRDYLVKAFYEIIEKYYPGEYKTETIKKNFWKGFSEILLDEIPSPNKKVMEEFHAVKVAHYHKILFFPGVKEGLNELKKKGFQLGIVSNQNRQVSINVLKENNLYELFDVIIALDDVQEGKPSPEGINKVIQQLGCKANEVIMIGDSRYDIMAGHRAGVLTGFFKWYEDISIPEEHPPHFTFENFDMLLNTLMETEKKELK